jgi:hypothetical protein
VRVERKRVRAQQAQLAFGRAAAVVTVVVGLAVLGAVAAVPACGDQDDDQDADGQHQRGHDAQDGENDPVHRLPSSVRLRRSGMNDNRA